MKASKISLDNAKPDKLFYFVVNAVVFRESDQRCLILKRSEHETTHPSKWAVPGGKLEWADLDINHPTRMNGDVIDFENIISKLIKREVLEEASLEIEDELSFINDMAFVRPDEVPVVFIKFAAKYKSGDVKIEEGSFTDSAWVNASEVLDYDCIKGIDQEIKMTIDNYTKNNT
jgi:ADP-ribose pyrophosphatase YjhB (NUDIX family)